MKEVARRLLHTLKADYAAVIDELYDSAATATKAVAAKDNISFLVEKENKTEALRRLSNHLFKN